MVAEDVAEKRLVQLLPNLEPVQQPIYAFYAQTAPYMLDPRVRAGAHRRHQQHLENQPQPGAMRWAYDNRTFEAAITAIMRKLAILANAVLRNKRKWTPKPA
ncbi:hypothetical protein [Mesorhizobium amorphae]|uniref:hypothetical protein n=1 Tax=Mesorhizobium amorphae TaxID=71433 RepID=UPI0017822E15|nr:hypothetical protein [Mesorhizobium amorphae]